MIVHILKTQVQSRVWSCLVSFWILCYSKFSYQKRKWKKNNIKMAQKLSCKKPFHAVLEAPLHYRALERDKVRGLNNCNDFDQYINLSEESLSELNSWIKNVKFITGKHIRPPKPSICPPIYGINRLNISFSGTKGQWPWDLVCSIGDVISTRFAQMMNLA